VRGSDKESNDEGLMLALKAGDEAAFEVLYRRYRDRLYAFLLRYTGDPTAAQDLFQETFLRVFRDRARYERRAAFVTWLFTIAWRLYLDHRRAGGRAKELLIGSPTALATMADVAPGPLRTIENAEEARRLAAALVGLPEKDRAILLLSRLEGLRYAEIAKILGTSKGAVKVRAHRALLQLRRTLLP
jgi:RNA polymerase sigma-70 factor (ECF subfamily)